MSDATQYLASDFGAPYWASDTAPAPSSAGPLPDTADVVVIGAGYTGLNAALTAARAGSDVVVVDREVPGNSASGRNGGHVSTSMKPGLQELSSKLGADRARAILKLGHAAVAYLDGLIDAETLACDYEQCGHFTGAHKPAAVKGLHGWAKEQRDLGNPVDEVSRADQHAYIGSDHFHGGIFMPNWKSLHPGKYVTALAGRVAECARIFADQNVVRVSRVASGVEVAMAGGHVIRAKSAIVATNAQTSTATPALPRRIITIASVSHANEPLDPGMLSRLHPRRDTCDDSRRLVTYTRPSPDGRRVLVGSRVRFRPGAPEDARAAMHRRMEMFFPELAGVRSDFVWGGLVGYTFDHLPQVGTDGPVHYAMGYCGTGVAMASYLGSLVGQRAAGLSDRDTSLDGLPVKSLPLYNGRPWFLPFAFAWYGFLDRFA